MHVPLYALALSFLQGISQAQALTLYRNCTSVEALFAGQLPADLTPDFAQRLRIAIATHGTEALAQAKAELAFCADNSIEVLPLGAENYPLLLGECADAPLVLFYKGTASLNAPHSISVVGTRKITPVGTDLCRHLCKDLAMLLPQTLIVSGLAYGVDIAIHREALKNGLPTVGVLAHGLGQTVYPSLHRQTASEMVQQGGLLTEYPHYVTPKREFFVRRNRIVAGMSAGTVVVESASKGGALITARLAGDYNRLVMAYPGRAFDPYSAGCNELIRQQLAALVTSASDIVSTMGWSNASPSSVPIQQELFPLLTPEEQRLCNHLATTERATINELALALNLPSQQLLALLFDLELRGIVRNLPGGHYGVVR